MYMPFIGFSVSQLDILSNLFVSCVNINDNLKNYFKYFIVKDRIKFVFNLQQNEDNQW